MDDNLRRISMKFIKDIINAIVLGIGRIHWKPKKLISIDDRRKIRQLLTDNYLIIVTHRSNHLSTFFVCLSNFLLTGKWGYWAHTLMNVEDEVTSDHDFRLVEAVGTGVQYTPFDNVFDVQGVALLKPRKMSLEQWTLIMDKAKTQLGKPYDSLFDLKSDKALSCVELVRLALMAETNYAQDFSNFEHMITNNNNLTPQMFYECKDFEIVFEVRV